MNNIWDKVRDGIDRAGKVAQDALDEGKLRLEAYRAREAADKAAEAVGYGVFRAAEAGMELEPATRDRLFTALRERDGEARRLEASLEAMKAGADPAPEPAPAATGGAATQPAADASSTETASATPPNVDATGTSGQGGS